MPRVPAVPTIDRRQVPGVSPIRETNLNVPIEALGGGQVANQIGQSLNNLFGVAQDIYTQEKKKADDVLVTEAENALIKAQTKIQTDIALRKGKDAFGSLDYGSREWETNVSEIQKILTNDDQKALFKEIQSKRFNNIYDYAYKHQAVEGERYKEEVHANSLSLLQSEAIDNYSDFNKVATSVAEQESRIKKYALDNGKGEEWAKNEIERNKSRTNVGIISRMLNAGDDMQAEAYFNNIKESLTSDDLIAVEKVVSVGSFMGKTQREVDRIASMTTSLGVAFEETRKIDDPKLRELVNKGIRQRFEENKVVQNERQNALFDGIAKEIETTASRDKIPLESWLALSNSQRNAIDARISQLRTKTEPVTDWQTYYDYKTLASSPATRASFKQVNLFEIRSKLADAEFKELVSLQNKLINGEDDANSILDGYLTESAIVGNGIAALKIDTEKPVGKERAAQFKRMVQLKQLDYQRANNKKAGDKEIQHIVDDLTREVVVERKFLWDTKKSKFEIEAETTINDIPEEERKQIREALAAMRAKGLTQYRTDDAAVIDLYLRKKTSK